MPFYLRRLLFFTFAIVFVLAAPLVVLYTAGYRINSTTGRIQRTGVIAFSTSPKGADITLNGKLLSNRTPTVAQRLMPGEYSVTLEKKGYTPWEQHVTVESGRTTYVSGYLFAQSTPELLLEEDAVAVAANHEGRTAALLVKTEDGFEMWLYDTATRTQQFIGDVIIQDGITPSLAWSINEDAIVVLNGTTALTALRVDDGSTVAMADLDALTNVAPEMTLVDNGVNVEVHTTTLLSLLPLSTYTVIDRHDDHVLLRDTRGRTLLLSLTTGEVSVIDMPSTYVDWREESGLYVASDGNEIDIMNISTGEKELITRQSTPLIGVMWHPSGGALFAATSDTLFAIESARYQSRVTTTLASNITIQSMWMDANGKAVFFYGVVNDIAGLYRVKLIK
jgi:hypothetical protein